MQTAGKAFKHLSLTEKRLSANKKQREKRRTDLQWRSRM
jgi:hypothetical protein